MQKPFLSDAQLSKLSSDEQEQFIQGSLLCGGSTEDFNKQYQNLKQIGDGSFGTVFMIRDLDQETFQALKRMPAQINDYKKNQVPILKELQIVQRMYEVGEDFRFQKYVMKCQKYYYIKKQDEITGQILFQLLFIYQLAQCDLEEIIESNRRQKINFTENQTIKFLWQGICGLKILQDQYQIKHRDLKPKNILVQPKGIYLIGDFTTCKIKLREDQMSQNENNNNKSSILVGTKEYWPPEVNRIDQGLVNEQIKELSNGKIDVFSLGIVAFCLLFHQVKASQLTQLSDQGNLIKELLFQIKDYNLRQLLTMMTQWDCRNRFNLGQCFEFVKSNFGIQIQEFEQQFQESFQVDYLNQEKRNLTSKIEFLQKDLEQLKIQYQDQQKYLQYQQNNQQQQINPFIKNQTETQTKQQKVSQQYKKKMEFLNLTELENSYQNKKNINPANCSDILNACFNQQGDLLAFGTNKGIEVWELNSKKQIQIENIQYPNSQCWGTGFTSDGQYLIQNSFEGFSVSVYQFVDGVFQFKDQYQFQDQQFWKVSIRKNQNQFICSTYQGMLLQFNIISEDNKNIIQLKNQLKAYDKPIYGLSYSNNEKFVASASQNGLLSIWEQENLKKKQQIQLKIKDVLVLQFSSQDEKIFCGGEKGQITIYEVQKNQEIQILKGPSLNYIRSIYVSFDDQIIFSGDDGCNLVLWKKSQQNLQYSQLNTIKTNFYICSITVNHENIMAIGCGNQIQYFQI